MSAAENDNNVVYYKKASQLRKTYSSRNTAVGVIVLCEKKPIAASGQSYIDFVPT